MWGIAALGVLTGSIFGIFRDHAPGMEGWLSLLIMVAFGAFGNYWYFKKVNRLITAQRKLASSYQTAIPKISSKGGTTFVPLFASIALIVVPLMYFWITQPGALSPIAQPPAASRTGMFDDLMPDKPRRSSGLFDDLLQDKPSRGMTDEEVFGPGGAPKPRLLSDEEMFGKRNPSPSDSSRRRAEKSAANPSTATNTHVQNDAVRFWRDVDAAIPNFNLINSDPRWFRYLDTHVPGTNVSYREVANMAVAKNDSALLIEVVRGWERSVSPPR